MTDIFPALVAVYAPDVVAGMISPYESIGIADGGATRFYESRVIVHKNLVLVGADSPRGPQKMFSDSVVSVSSDGKFTRVTTAGGFLVVFSKSRGCGCGSRLRSWNPYVNGASSSRD